MTLTLINGWRWRTHVAALMRQFVQFCKKTMVVHFIARRLRGYIGMAASFHTEFRPVINPGYVAPGTGGITARSSVARAVRDSIQMPSLKSVSYFLNTKSETVNAVAFHILPRACRKPALDHFITLFQTSHLKNRTAAMPLSCVFSSVGLQLGTWQQKNSMNRLHSYGFCSLFHSEPGSCRAAI